MHQKWPRGLQISMLLRPATRSFLLSGLIKGMFCSESAGEMWNRHVKVPKIVPGLLIPVSDINCSNQKLIFTFFFANKINLFKARTNMN